MFVEVTRLLILVLIDIFNLNYKFLFIEVGKP